MQKLNEAQMLAVTAPLGPTMVLAGAGSGKTRVLTNRILYLVENCGVNPREILAITFTNKAANEMKNRLWNFDCHAEEMQISTIHSFCAKVLRNEAERFQRNGNFSIYSEEDKHSLLKKVVKDFFDDADSKVVDSFGDSISSLKNNAPEFNCDSVENLLTASDSDELVGDEFDKLSHISQEGNETLAQIIADYTNRMKENNALDFDDLLYYVFKLFVNSPEVLDSYAERYKYILIDEFQDVNKVQYNIFKMLAGKYQNIFVVGDDDQSIYSWRGADSTNMIRFSKDFPSAKLFKLEQNYRSTKKILDTANKIIAVNSGRFEKVLWTENEDGLKPQMFSAYNEQDEAYYVVGQIKQLCDLQGYNYRDCAILMRINALSRCFEAELGNQRIPYKVFGGFKFFERKEIRDVLSYLRLIDNPQDNEAFARAINVPRRRGIGDTTLERLRVLSSEYALPIIDLISDERNLESLAPSARKKLLGFYEEYDGFYQLSKKKGVAELAHTVISCLEFRETYMEEGDDDRALNVDQLEQMIIDFQKSNPLAKLSDYLQTVSLVSDTDNADDTDYVTVSTVHAAKGLEFKVVFVVGLEEGIFPSSRSTFDWRDIQEERRLMYVAVTRAEKRLYLTLSQSRFLYGERRRSTPSKFYNEVAKMTAPVRPQPTERDLSDNSFLDKLNREAPSVAPKNTGKTNQEIKSFKVGQHVSHTSFGNGIILRIDGDVAYVVFDKVGQKQLNVRFAPLSIIG